MNTDILTEPDKITLEPHPWCLIFPEMDAASFAALKEDIRLHGQRENIITHEGKILDGRHRFRA